MCLLRLFAGCGRTASTGPRTGIKGSRDPGIQELPRAGLDCAQAAEMTHFGYRAGGGMNGHCRGGVAILIPWMPPRRAQSHAATSPCYWNAAPTRSHSERVTASARSRRRRRCRSGHLRGRISLRPTRSAWHGRRRAKARQPDGPTARRLREYTDLLREARTSALLEEIGWAVGDTFYVVLCKKTRSSP